MAMEQQARDGVELTRLVQEPGAATVKLQSSLLDRNLPKNGISAAGQCHHRFDPAPLPFGRGLAGSRFADRRSKAAAFGN